MNNAIKIGTRGSQLALWQAHWVKDQLEKKSPEIQVQIVKIKTTGDRITDRPLAMVGGKGLFVKEIEQQLLDKDIDIAVHSMKDMPGELPDGLCIGAVPVRENPFDVLISRDKMTLDTLPQGAKVGTSSLRRASQIRHLRPDVQTLSIRGNLDTRIRKLENGEYDAIILAAAGLIRLGMGSKITQYLDDQQMLPAVGQGALCIESRQGDSKIDALLQTIDDRNTRIPVESERAFLKQLEGSCHIPVACFGTIDSETITLTGLVASEDGGEIIRERITGTADDAQKMGIELANTLLNRGAKEILERIVSQ